MGSRGSHARRWACAAGVVAAATLAVAPVAPAASDGDPWLAGIAQRLRADPIYVSDSVTRAVSAAELSRLRAAVRAMPWPTRVVILGSAPGNRDVRGTSLYDVPGLLGGALDRRGLYVVTDATDDISGTVHVAAVGVRPHVSASEVAFATLTDYEPKQRVAGRVRYALRVAATGERPLRGAARRALDADEPEHDDPNATEDAVAITGIGVGGLAGFAIPAWLWWRRGRTPRPQPRRRSGRERPRERARRRARASPQQRTVRAAGSA